MLVSQLGAPPQVVWVRIGNARTRALLDFFDANLDGLLNLLDDGAALIALEA